MEKKEVKKGRNKWDRQKFMNTIKMERKINTNKGKVNLSLCFTKYHAMKMYPVVN
jgi:hypothetical protein